MAASIRLMSSCSRTYAENLSLRQAIALGSLYFEAPEDLRRRVRSAVRQANREGNTPRHMRWEWKLLWASLGTCALVLLMVFTFHTPPAENLMVQEVLSAHLRSLLPGHIMDIPSSDQHTVKPWFNGRLDFSPPVRDFASQGFALTGGRLDYVGNRQVAALVYQHRKHIINLFIRPSPRSDHAEEKSFTEQGYNLIVWNQSGMVYMAISDLNMNKLRDFVQLVSRPGQ